MSRYVFIVALVAVGLFAVPASAIAQRCEAPQGTSAVDQYCEVVPDSRGDRDAGPEGGPTISSGTTTALTTEGADGEALARALGSDPAVAKAKPGSKGSDDDARQSGGVTDVVVPDTPSSNPFAAVTRAVGGEATLGSPFFLALFGVVVLMLGCAWVGYRRGKSA